MNIDYRRNKAIFEANMGDIARQIEDAMVEADIEKFDSTLEQLNNLLIQYDKKLTRDDLEFILARDISPFFIDLYECQFDYCDYMFGQIYKFLSSYFRLHTIVGYMKHFFLTDDVDHDLMTDIIYKFNEFR